MWTGKQGGMGSDKSVYDCFLFHGQYVAREKRMCDMAYYFIGCFSAQSTSRFRILPGTAFAFNRASSGFNNTLCPLALKK